MKQYHGTYACFFLFHVSDDRALCKPGCASLVVIHWYSWRFLWWLVMFVFIDLKWPRVFRCSTPSCWLCSHHRIIMKFSGVITSDKSDVHAKGQGQRSKVKVTEVTTPLNRFRTVTPVWIHIWWWNDAYSLIMLRRGALLFFKVIRQISRSHGSKNCRIWPRLGVSGL